MGKFNGNLGLDWQLMAQQQGQQQGQQPAPPMPTVDPQWQNRGASAVDQYADDGRRAINPWQKAGMERKAENTHNVLTDAYQDNLGRAPDREGLDWWKAQAQTDSAGLSNAVGGIANSPEADRVKQALAERTAAADAIRAAATPQSSTGFASDDAMYRAAASGQFGDFSAGDRQWYRALANDLQAQGGTGTQYLSDLDNRSFVGDPAGLASANEQKLANLLGQTKTYANSLADTQRDEAINPTPPSTTTTAGGITFDDRGPVGGIVNPSQTFTPHTGFTEGGGVRTGTGGGEAEPLPQRPMSEGIAARPDLRSSSRRPIVQAEVGPAARPVQSIQSQMAQAKALRSAGEG